MTEEHEPAMCPGCNTLLHGSREPGEEDTCAETGEDVVLVEPTDEAVDRRGPYR